MLMIMTFAAAVDAIIMKNVAAATAAVVTSAASAVVVVIPEVVVGKLALSSSATMLKTSPRVVLRSCFMMMYDDNGWLCDMMPRCNVDDAGPLLRHNLLCLEPQMSC